MLSRLRTAGLFWPTLISIPALLFLLALGTWQMNRKAWKDGLQSLIDARVTASPQLLTPGLVTGSLDPKGLEYLRVKAAGTFLHGQERHLYWPGNGGQGWQVHTPLMLEDGRIVLVNRGWVPEPLKDPAKRADSQRAGRVEVTGLLRLQEAKGYFTPDNDPARNIWFWRDIPAMLQCRSAIADAGCKALQEAGNRAYSFAIDQERGPGNAGEYPRGGTTNLELTNRHLEYAITWYGLALTLIGVFSALVVSRLKPGSPELGKD